MRNHLLSTKFQSICGYFIDQKCKSFVHNTGVTNWTDHFPWGWDKHTHTHTHTHTHYGQFLYISKVLEGHNQFHDRSVLVLNRNSSPGSQFCSSPWMSTSVGPADSRTSIGKEILKVHKGVLDCEIWAKSRNSFKQRRGKKALLWYFKCRSI